MTRSGHRFIGGLTVARRRSRSRRRRWTFVPVVATALAAFASQALSAAPDVDPTFGGGDGLSTADFGSTTDEGSAVAIQPDGRIVVVGGRNLGGDFDSDDFALARFDTAGNLDGSFGADGRVITDLGTDRDEARAVAIQADGRIVAGGWDASDFTLARYHPNGSLDTAFGSDGMVTTDLGGGDFVADLAIQPDGKIVAVGGTAASFAVARYLPDGALDPAFEGDGTLTTPFPGGGGAASAVAIQADGKLVVAGRAPCDPICRDFALARYDSNGSLDPAFGTGGRVTTDFGGDFDSAFDVVLQADGRIVAAGRGASRAGVPGEGFALARYLPDGSLDTSFDGDGRTIVDYGQAANDAEALALGPDETILVGGSVWRGAAKANFALARLNPDGSPDLAFSRDGRIEDDFGNGHDRITGLALQADGKIVAAGVTGQLTDDSFAADFAVVRYLPDGEPDPTPPETQIVEGPEDGSMSSSTQMSIRFVGSDNIDASTTLAFACSFDGAPFADCTSPAALVGLADGAHRFEVRARDRFGNVDSTPASRAWTVDATPPDSTLTGTPPPLTRERSRALSFSGTDGITPPASLAFECALDGAAAARCTSPHVVDELTDGRHTFAVWAVDLAGNREPTPATHEWTVDGTPPAKPRVRGPRKTSSRRVTYRFSSTDGIASREQLAFRCRFDARTLRPCPKVLRVRLRRGKHLLRVVAVDEAGNASTPARIRVTIEKRRK